MSAELLSGAAAPPDPFAEGLLDSLAIEQLIAHLEERFGVRFADDDVVAENFATLDRVAALVESKRRDR